MWLLAPFFLDPAHWLHPAALIFVLIGFFRPSLSANLSVAGMRYLGPTMSGTLSATSPLFGVAFGIIILGEALTLPLSFGILGVVAGAIVISRRGGGKAARSWPLWALALPVGAAIIRSAGHVLAKIGMEDIPDAYFASLATFSVSALITLVLHFVQGTPQPINWKNSGPWWFVLSGVVFTVAVVALNMALKQGEVVTVVPIVAASPVFTMLLSIYVFRRETLTPRIVLAVLMVVTSVGFIGLNR